MHTICFPVSVHRMREQATPSSFEFIDRPHSNADRCTSKKSCDVRYSRQGDGGRKYDWIETSSKQSQMKSKNVGERALLVQNYFTQIRMYFSERNKVACRSGEKRYPAMWPFLAQCDGHRKRTQHITNVSVLAYDEYGTHSEVVFF